VAADYAAAELHTLAQACLDLFGKSKLATALNEGLDPHLWFGSEILAVEYDEAKRRIAEGNIEIKNARQLAKAANFGFPGGCSARRFIAIAHGYHNAQGDPIELNDYTAQQLKALWFRTWPEMRDFFDHVGHCEDAKGWYWVDQPRTHRLRARATYTAACNSHFQGLAADGAKRALFEVTRRQFCEPKSALYGTAIVNFVHDEIIIECPEARCHEAACELERVMSHEFNALVPDCPTTAEAVVMRYWSKKAKRLEDDRGRIVPWPATG